jgi:hypothetical protein
VNETNFLFTQNQRGGDTQLTMKKLQFIFATLTSLSLVFLLTACPGPQGEPGPAGTNGTNGTNGKDGNANVIQITYGVRTHSGTEINYSLTGVTQSILNNSAYFTYVNPNNGFWYSLPGTTAGGTREYRTLVDKNATATPRLYVNRVAGTGTETFTETRIVIIPASELRNGRKASIDYSNYEEVKKAYNLPD